MAVEFPLSSCWHVEFTFCFLGNNKYSAVLLTLSKYDISPMRNKNSSHAARKPASATSTSCAIDIEFGNLRSNRFLTKLRQPTVYKQPPLYGNSEGINMWTALYIQTVYFSDVFHKNGIWRNRCTATRRWKLESAVIMDVTWEGGGGKGAQSKTAQDFRLRLRRIEKWSIFFFRAPKNWD